MQLKTIRIVLAATDLFLWKCLWKLFPHDGSIHIEVSWKVFFNTLPPFPLLGGVLTNTQDWCVPVVNNFCIHARISLWLVVSSTFTRLKRWEEFCLVSWVSFFKEHLVMRIFDEKFACLPRENAAKAHSLPLLQVKNEASPWEYSVWNTCVQEVGVGMKVCDYDSIFNIVHPVGR